MTTPPAHLKSAVEAALALPYHGKRVRYLAGFPAERAGALAEAFIAYAQAVIRAEPRSALQGARLALLQARRAQAQAVALRALRVAAETCLVLGRFRFGLRLLERAAAVAQETGDPAQAAELDILRIHPLVHLEQYDAADEAGLRALARCEAAGDRAGQIRSQMALADLALRLDRPCEALRRYSVVDGLLPDDPPDRLLAVLAANRANALQARNRFRAADRHFQRARALFARAGCHHSVAQVDYNHACVKALRGHFEAALRSFAEAEPLFRRFGDERHVALIDLDRAEIHVQLNLPEEAAALARSAERRFGALGMAKERAQAALIAGRAAEQAGEPDAAAADFERAEQAFLELGLPERRAGCLLARASLALGQQGPEAARALTAAAEAALAGIPRGATRAALALLEARIDLEQGQPTRALHAADSVRVGCRHTHLPATRIAALRLQARAYAARGDTEEALLAYKRTIDELERYRGQVPPDEYMAAFLSGQAELYTEVVRLLARSGYAELAFEYTERAKSRALVDLLSDRAALDNSEWGSPLTAQRVRHLRERLNAIYQRLLRHEGGREQRSPAAVLEAQAEATRIEQRIARLLREAQLQDRAAALTTVDTPDLAGVRRDLDADTALLEFLVTERELYGFVVTKERFHLVVQDVPSAALCAMVERFRQHLSKFDRGHVLAEPVVLAATRANLGDLTRLLLAPVAEHLEGCRRIAVVPHGVLHHVPFHALPWGGEWVADRFEVVYAPSAAVYGLCRRKPSGAAQGACVFGLPDATAPEIEAEVRSVAQRLGSDRLFLGADATLERLRAEGGRARWIHVATHGMFRPEEPMLSSIRLADTWANLYDIYAMELCAELVVLSACESGIAKVTEGDEILGLSRGFLYAGARALLTTQWRVHDATTTELMDHFYRGLRETGDAADALRRAMAAVREERPHPYYWAPFFLTGRPLPGPRRGERERSGAAARQGAPA